MFCRTCGRSMSKGSGGRVRDPFYCSGCDRTAGRCRCRPAETEDKPVTAGGRGLATAAYWYFLMTTQGGPDGSDLDAAVADDLLVALREWAGRQGDRDYLANLPEPLP